MTRELLFVLPQREYGGLHRLVELLSPPLEPPSAQPASAKPATLMTAIGAIHRR